MTAPKRLLVSACLIGHPVRYDGDTNSDKVLHLEHWLQHWQTQGRLVLACPESLGGLPTPRPAAEITGASGEDVLDGSGRVATLAQQDVSAEFIRGAAATLAIAQREGINAALLAARSPSCGKGLIYDGSFSRQAVQGNGVTVALLLRHDISCFGPDDADALIAYMEPDQNPS
jgi:uncharacterized protein YbbK (DUF523 family)